MKIGIIGAMEEEVSILRGQIEHPHVETIAGYEYTAGKMKGKDVILLRSGIGKVNAALSTGLLLQTYAPDCLINTGSAGGANPALHVGDVVISTEVRHHDVDATVFGYEYGQVPQMPPAFLADEKLVRIAESCDGKLPGIQVVKGLIATGDSFMDDPAKTATVKEHFPEVQAVEMEAVAVAQVAWQFGIPFVIIRSLSDIAGQESGISFDEYLETAAVNSAHLVTGIVENL